MRWELSGLFLKILIFTKETEVSVPATAYHYTEKGFYVRATEDSQYQKGFVTLNSEQFTVYQVDA